MDLNMFHTLENKTARERRACLRYCVRQHTTAARIDSVAKAGATVLLAVICHYENPTSRGFFRVLHSLLSIPPSMYQVTQGLVAFLFHQMSRVSTRAYPHILRFIGNCHSRPIDPPTDRRTDRRLTGVEQRREAPVIGHFRVRSHLAHQKIYTFPSSAANCLNRIIRERERNETKQRNTNN